MVTVSRRRALAVIAGGAGLAALPGPAFANEPVPGVGVILSQNPGGLTVTGVTDRNGTVTLRPTATGTYNVVIPRPEQITVACVLVIQQPGREVVTSDPFGPVPRNTSNRGQYVSSGPQDGKTSSRGFVCAKGGGALALIVPQPPRGQPFAAITIRTQTYDPPPVVRPRAGS